MKETPQSWGGVPGFELQPWRRAYGVVAGITDRSTNFMLPDQGLPSGFTDLLEGLGGDFGQVVVSRQVHGAEVGLQRLSGAGVRRLEGLDGLVTSEAGVVLAVTTADCVPVYLVHPPSGALGIFHAGWRGIAAGIVERGIGSLARASAGLVPDIVMHCGVAICGECYEVGPEVLEALGMPVPGGPAVLNLRGQVAERAHKMGVSEITVSSWCTVHHHERFHSHRASHGSDDRQVAFIGRPAA